MLALPWAQIFYLVIHLSDLIDLSSVKFDCQG